MGSLVEQPWLWIISGPFQVDELDHLPTNSKTSIARAETRTSLAPLGPAATWPTAHELLPVGLVDPLSRSRLSAGSSGALAVLISALAALVLDVVSTAEMWMSGQI